MTATWVGYPRSWTSGRPRPIQYVVIHATAGSEGPSSAEAGAAYDKARTDGTSTHIFVDSDSAVREVPDEHQAHAARYHGNILGLQVEICGQANQSASQWADATSAPTLRRAAREVAEMCKSHNIPVRRLTVAECRAAWYAPAGQRPKGIVGHVDVTAAYPEDSGTHTDPGPGFPWAGFLQMVSAELTALSTTPPTPTEADMTPAQETHLLAMAWRTKAILDNAAAVQDGPTKGERNELHFQNEAVQAKLASPVAVTVDAAAVAAALAGNAAFLDALATAAADKLAARLKD